jgi:putative transposase
VLVCPTSRPPAQRRVRRSTHGYVESFNSRVRDKCLNINIFWSLPQARVVITDWKEEYNEHRRHSALGYQAPARYAAACTHR